MLELSGVTFSYSSGVPVLRDLSLAVNRGEVCAIVGPSGCGKSTLLHLIAGFLTPSQGSIRFEGADMAPIPPEERPFNIVFQDLALFPHMTAFDNVAFSLRARRCSRPEIDRRVNEILHMVRLAQDEASRLPEALSGGQKQRVALARALVNRPRVLLLDEVFRSLDRPLRMELLNEVIRLQRATETTVVFATHEPTEAFLAADRLVVMKSGTICQVGPPQELYDAPRSAFVAALLGEKVILYGRVDSVAGDHIRVRVKSGETFRARAPIALAVDECVQCFVASSRIRICLDSQCQAETLEGRVLSTRPQGDARVYDISLQSSKALERHDSVVRITRPMQESVLPVDSIVRLDWDWQSCQCFCQEISDGV